MNPAVLVVLFLALNGTWAVFWVAFRHKQDVGHSRPTAAMLFLQAVFHVWIAKAALLSLGLLEKLVGVLFLIGAICWARLAYRFAVHPPASDSDEPSKSTV